MKLDLKRENLSEIISAIKGRKNIDFCVIYEFLAHDKLLDICFSKTKEV